MNDLSLKVLCNIHDIHVMVHVLSVMVHVLSVMVHTCPVCNGTCPVCNGFLKNMCCKTVFFFTMKNAE